MITAIVLLTVAFTAYGRQMADGDATLVISGDKIVVKQDLSRGGAICYISRADSDFNIVNIADEGRYIQQSYYGGKVIDRRAQGQGDAWTPWAWNPIQVGDYKRNRARILEAVSNDSSTYVKCVPMLWDMDNEPAQAVMEQWTTLNGHIIHVRNRLVCHRTDSIYGEGYTHDQEIPAVYPISSLCRLYTYNGAEPFTGASVSQLDVVQLVMNTDGGGGTWGRYDDISEKWMAFVDDNGWGLAVYSPSATRFLAGRSDADITGTEYSGSTSYIAPLRREKLMKNSIVEYEYYLIIDTLDNIRAAVYKINAGTL